MIDTSSFNFIITAIPFFLLLRMMWQVTEGPRASHDNFDAEILIAKLPHDTLPSRRQFLLAIILIYFRCFSRHILQYTLASHTAFFLAAFHVRQCRKIDRYSAIIFHWMGHSHSSLRALMSYHLPYVFTDTTHIADEWASHRHLLYIAEYLVSPAKNVSSTTARCQRFCS